MPSRWFNRGHRTLASSLVAKQAFQDLGASGILLHELSWMDEDILPPTEPPPILRPRQIQHLAHQGWLSVDLKPGLDAELEKLSQASATFFDLDHVQKTALYPASHGTERGFYHVEAEKEYLTLRHEVYAESELEKHAKEVWRQTTNFLHRILCDMSRAAGYDMHGWNHLVRDSLDPPTDDRRLGDVLTLMRLFRYYPTAGIAEQHVDIGLLTLCIGNGKGLQVLDWTEKKDPIWVDATGPTVLVGDMARALMLNQFRAGIHRVVGNPAGRSSIILALRPCVGEPTDLTKFGGKGIVDTREYFYKIKGSKYNINATHAIRQKQRLAQREGKGHGQSKHYDVWVGLSVVRNLPLMYLSSLLRRSPDKVPVPRCRKDPGLATAEFGRSSSILCGSHMVSRKTA